MLDIEHVEEQARRCAGSSQRIPARERLERVVEAPPSSENLNKPQGVKKARVTKAKVAEVSHCL